MIYHIQLQPTIKRSNKRFLKYLILPFLILFNFVLSSYGQVPDCSQFGGDIDVLRGFADLNVSVGAAEEFTDFNGNILSYRFNNDDALVWDLSKPIGEWPGVTVNETQKEKVKGLYLNDFGLASRIPTYIGCLTALDSLDLSNNSLRDTIPSSLGQLNGLLFLNLSDNQLTGNIPNSIFQDLTNLTFLDLSNNWKRNVVPNSGITGRITANINTNNLQVLKLSNNRLEGRIPDQLGLLTSLRIINLSDTKGLLRTEGNKFSAFPNQINWPQLEEIYIDNNDLQGQIPEGLWQSNALRVVDLSENNLSGMLPTQLVGLPQLNTLFLYKNNLLGELPTLGANVTAITDINLSDNAFTGAFPASYAQLADLRKLIINKNEINDISLIDFSLLNNLEELNISENDLEDLPDNWALPNSLNFLQLQSNRLTFEDFLPNNILTIENKNGSYYPQDSVGDAQIIEIPVGEDILLDQIVDEGIQPAAEYQWYKDGQAIDNTELSELQIVDAQVENEGQYTFIASHPQINTDPQFTLLSRPIVLRVNTACEEQDKEAITALYNNTNGAIWTRPWNLNDATNNLEGVTVDEATGCIVKLEIDNQALDGIIPNDIGNISNLQRLLFTRSPDLVGTVPNGVNLLANLEELVISSTGINNIEAETLLPLNALKTLRLKDNRLNELPDLSAMVNLEIFEVDYNQLTFEDIIPNINVLTSYAPQDSIGNADNPILNIGQNYTYNMPLFDQGLNNTYQWFKDGMPLAGGRDLALADLQLDDSGIYYCQITNPEAPDLILVTRKITLEVREDCQQVDYNALQAIYDNTDGLNWIWNDPDRAWDFSTPDNIDMSNWEGVQVSEQGCVKGLFLENKGMNGQLPDDIGDLLNLDTLVISGNVNLDGRIPETIGLLSNLVHLDLSNNRISQNVPASIGDLTGLTYLALNANDLEGELPQSIGQLIALRKLLLSNNIINGNGLSGNLPASIGNLTLLDTLLAGQNKFTGQIPETIGQLVNLKQLDLTTNRLEGPLPQSLFDLANLESINLSINRFDGNIPVEFGNLTNLKELNLRDNEFTGDLPASITSLPLTRLLVNNNQLENIGDVSNLDIQAIINVAGNKLTFEDILDYVDLLDFYEPQDSVGQNQVEQLVVGQNYVFDLGIDEGLTTSIYTWKKDGVTIDVGNVNNFAIEDAQVEDAGEYTCEVTNPGAELLTLYSRKYVLTTDGSGGGGTELDILGDSLVCIESSLKAYEVINSSGNVTWTLDPVAGTLFSPNQTTTDVVWNSVGDFELTVTDNESQESITKMITLVEQFAPPRVDFNPIIVVNEPFEDVIATGAPNAQFLWFFNGEQITTGEVFNPGDITVNGFSNTDAGFYDFEVRQQGAQSTCLSEPRNFRIRIVEESLDAPENLVAQVQNDGEAVLLEWTFSQPAIADSVVIERAIDGTENFEVIAIVAYDGINEYVDNITLEDGIVYSYRIRMADFENDQVSPYSNIAQVRSDGSIDINNPPAVADITKTGKSGLEIAFLESDFVNAFSDPDSDTLVSITILSLPDNGTLLLNNTPVTVDQIITKEELAALTFISDEGWFGQTSFTYTASDGEEDAVAPANVIINITEEAQAEPADLVVGASADPTTVITGEDITFTISLLNQGETTAQDFTLTVYLSTDSTISADDQPVFNVTLDSLAPGQNVTQEQILNIPEGFEPGTYVVIFFADSNEGIDEINEDNNLAFVEITVSEVLQEPVIPNIITPNGDLVNDFLVIENIEQYPDNTLIVLNKWGIEVFKTDNYQNNWSGTDNDGIALPAGNYMVILTIRGENSGEYTEVLTIIK